MSINLFVKLYNKTKVILVDKFDTIDLVCTKLNLTGNDVYLTWNTKILNSLRTLNDYDIADNNLIYVNFRLRAGRELPPALKLMLETNKKVSTASGYPISPGLISFMTQFRDQAKKIIQDDKNHVAINKKAFELFQEYLNKVGKQKVFSEMEKVAEEIKKRRAVKRI